MANGKLEYKVTKEDEGKLVKEILRSRMNFSVKLLTKVKYHGDILLNGKHVTVRQRVVEGDVLTAEYPEEES